MIFTTEQREFARQIKVVAVGGGASRALDRMLVQWPRPPCTVAVDTDDRSLDAGRAAARLPLGVRLAKGFGSGGDPRVGKLAAEETVAEWRSLCADTDWMIMTTALGGGTATGAAPFLARVAMACGTRVVALATLPFEFEGAERQTIANRGLSELHAACDAVIAIPNSALFASAAGPNIPAAETFAAADGAVGLMLAILCRMVTGQGLMTLDLPSLHRFISGRTQPAAYGFGRSTGDGRAAAALADLIGCPMLEADHALASAEAVWAGIVAGPQVTFGEIEQTLLELRAALKPEALLLTGAYCDEAFGDFFHLAALTVGPLRKHGEPDLTKMDVSSPLSHSGKRFERPRSPVQEQLTFESPNKGRFKGVDPTLVEGEDLDIPTFIRRKIRFEPAR